MTVYIVITVVSFVTLTADMILRYMEKIRSFGMESRFHHIKGKTIPVEDLIPHNLTMAAVFLLALGITGILLKIPDVSGFVVLPVSVMSGALANFFIMHFLYPRIFLRPIPEKADLSECEAVCDEGMDANNYGSVSVSWKGRKYSFPAFPANENTILKGEAVIILHREDGVCFVEKPERIMDILNEPQEDVDKSKRK